MGHKKGRDKAKGKHKKGKHDDGDKAKGEKRTPSVMEFLTKLGGAPEAPRKRTPARGLLGDISREDLVKAGRIEADSSQGPKEEEAAVEVEVSSPTQKAPSSQRPSTQRKEQRIPWTEKVRVASVLAGEGGEGQAQNLSTSGIFIETTRLLEEGDPVVLSFAGRGGAPINVSGRVRWVTPFGDIYGATPGMGIEFVGLDRRKRDRLEAILSDLPQHR